MSSRRKITTAAQDISDLEGTRLPFGERLRRALAHDLLTPLGTIANYAAILERPDQADPEEVRAFATRILASTGCLAKMLRHLAKATELSSSPRIVEVDADALLRSVLAELGMTGRCTLRSNAPRESVPFNLELLTFAWRSFLGIHQEAGIAATLDLEVVSKRDERTTVELSIADPSPSEHDRLKPSSSVADSMGEWPFALGLAAGLFQEQAGELISWGRPGQHAGLRVSLPSSEVGGFP